MVTALARAGLENPLVVTGPPAEVVHHGGFHALHLTAALDGASWRGPGGGGAGRRADRRGLPRGRAGLHLRTLAADQLAEAIAATRVLVAVELVAAVRALRMRRVVPPVALEGVWQVCGTMSGASKDRDLSEDVRLAEQLLDVLAPFVAGTGDDGEHPVQPEQPAEGP